MEKNVVPSPTNSPDVNGIKSISQDLRSYPEQDILNSYNDISVRKNLQVGGMDLSQGNWRHTELRKLECMPRISGSCESIFSQASIQSPGWSTLKSSKSQDAIASSQSFSQNQNWSYQENELEHPDIVDDVVGDEVNLKSTWQQLEEKKKDGQHNLSKASYSLSQIDRSTSQMSVSELLPEQTKTDSEKHFQHEVEKYQSKHGPSFNLFNSEDLDSDHFQVAESDGSQKISVSLLKSILMEREFKINDLNKEIRKVQSENLHMLEERQCLLSENDRLKREIEAMAFDTKRKEQDFFLSFDPCSPSVLQKEISNLKNQINDLQEANESAILELGKADEEISQQRMEFAKLKEEYTQKLEDSQEEIKFLKEQIAKSSSRLSHPETYQEGLQMEIAQLRSECRKLRTQTHQLNEENYHLKEDLFDLKMQHECLLERKNVLTSKSEEAHEPSDEDVCSVNQDREIVLTSSPQTIQTFGTPAIKLKTSTRQSLPVLPRRPFAPKSVADLNLGDLVKFSRPGGKISKGTIQYKGHLPGREEIYVGVELEGDELGKHDGMFQGTRYFLCKPNKGVFVNFSKVIMAWN